MNKSDYEFIKKIVNNTLTIRNFYKKLLELEINNQKDSKEYLKYLRHLNIAIKNEDMLYKNHDLTQEKCIKIMDYIIDSSISKKILSNYESILTQDYSNSNMRRILNTLSDKYNSLYKDSDNEMYDNLISVIKSVGIDNPKKLIEDSSNAGLDLRKAVEKDLIMGYLMLIEEAGNNKSYKLVKEDLIKSKYYTSFIDKNVEEEMLYYKFSTPTTLYTSSKLITDINHIDNYIYTMLKDSHLTDESNKQISKLLEIKDIDYDYRSTINTVNLRLCFMKSCFLLMDDDSIESTNYIYNKFIEDRPTNDNNISKNLITNNFKTIKKDKSKVIVLSLH